MGTNTAAILAAKKVAIYIPAYNQARFFPSVLDRIPREYRDHVVEIFLVDNCSTDDTQEVARVYKSKHGLKHFTILRNDRNLGYGGSQKVAYQRCIDRGYDVVVMLHGDGQYSPEKIGDVLEPVLSGRADLAFGSRILGNPLKGGMPLVRFLGNRGLTFLQNFLLGTKLSEYHSGYRVFSVPALKQVGFDGLATDYHFDSEIIYLFVENGLKIAEVPIPTYYGDERSFINIWSYGFKLLWTTAQFCMHCRGILPSARWEKLLRSGRNSKSASEIASASKL